MLLKASLLANPGGAEPLAHFYKFSWSLSGNLFEVLYKCRPACKSTFLRYRFEGQMLPVWIFHFLHKIVNSVSVQVFPKSHSILPVYKGGKDIPGDFRVIDHSFQRIIRLKESFL